MSSVYPNTTSQSTGDESYFVPGYGISRHIMFSHVHFYLGPYASVRPYSYQGREGYLVTAGRTLTKSQIEDLRNLSKQYEQQAAERMVIGGGAADDFYINRPIQVQQRRRYVSSSYGRSR